MAKAKITGSGSVLPNQRIENAHFEHFVFRDKDGTPLPKTGKEIAEKVESISGIRERRYISDDQDSVDLLVEASRLAISDAGIDQEELGAIIVAHNAGNMLRNEKGLFTTVPNMAAMLKNRLGVVNHLCPSYDIMFGCPGWVQGLQQANHLIKAGEANHVLVVGVEVSSRLLDPGNMDSMLMADGCGAVILSALRGGKKGILSTSVFSHAHDDLNNISVGKPLDPGSCGHSFFQMNGREVYRYATTYLPQVVKMALDKAALTPRDIDFFFFHQANSKMLDGIALNLMKLFGQEEEAYAHKIPLIISFTGNTSVATVPTLFDMVKHGKVPNFKLKSGQKWVFASVGAGMHCNAVVYQN